MLIDAKGRITDEAVAALRDATDMLECQCPGQLMGILDAIRAFEAYTTTCADRFPKDAAVHQWLRASAVNLDALLSSTLIQLARMEGYLDEEGGVVRVRATAKAD